MGETESAHLFPSPSWELQDKELPKYGWQYFTAGTETWI